MPSMLDSPGFRCDATVTAILDAGREEEFGSRHGWRSGPISPTRWLRHQPPLRLANWLASSLLGCLHRPIYVLHCSYMCVRDRVADLSYGSFSDTEPRSWKRKTWSLIHVDTWSGNRRIGQEVQEPAELDHLAGVRGNCDTMQRGNVISQCFCSYSRVMSNVFVGDR